MTRFETRHYSYAKRYGQAKQTRAPMISNMNNHHYVSQCLIKNFFNRHEKKIFIYDKKQDNYFDRQGTRRIFSENNLNITIDNNQLSDKLETDLDKYFEKNFKTHYDNIISSLTTCEGDIRESIKYIGRMGLVGEIRNKDYKKQTDVHMLGVFREISNHAAPELKQNIDKTLKQLDKLEYKTSVDFVKFADEVFSKMGDWSFNIFTTDSKYFFLLPDCTAVIKRHRINDYFNPDALDIAELGMPIDNHTYIHIVSNKVRTKNLRVKKLNDSGVLHLNKMTYEFAKQQVGCGDEYYLKETIKKIASP